MHSQIGDPVVHGSQRAGASGPFREHAHGDPGGEFGQAGVQRAAVRRPSLEGNLPAKSSSLATAGEA